MLGLNKFLKNSKGFTLPEVLIAAGILGGVSLVMMQLTSEQRKISNRSNQDNDFAQANARILNYYINPSDCNANFLGKSTTLTLDGVYKCRTPGACSNSSTPSDKIMPVNPATDQWNPQVNGISNNVYIYSMSATVSPTSATAAQVRILATATVQITFRLRQTASVNTATLNTNNSNFTKIFTVPVIVGTTSTILGCPKSFNSTVVY